MTKAETVKKLIEPRLPLRPEGRAFAPANIALCKYWGKRNRELNLPMNSSLSVSLGPLGSRTRVCRDDQDVVIADGVLLPPFHPFARRAAAYLELFRPEPDFFFRVETENTVPTAAGLASSASGFAALAAALDDFFGWNLDKKRLSILARLGSGSAARSVYSGFVLWHAGERDDGLDSFAEPLPEPWPELRLAALVLSADVKKTGSTQGMQHTVDTSPFYAAWPALAERDLERIRQAIAAHDFTRLGETAECNALAMHATMIAARPPLLYWRPETAAAMHAVWELRAAGTEVYFTIDAGPNVKLLFLEKDQDAVRRAFPEGEIIAPFEEGSKAGT